jgi:hypothetical protein
MYREAVNDWSEWRSFPNPQKCEYLIAPFGAGCYELRNRRTGKLVLFGKAQNVAARMSSLLPAPFGCGTRNNTEKREYVLANISVVEYRTIAFATAEESISTSGFEKA